VFAAGNDGTILHYDGSTWQKRPIEAREYCPGAYACPGIFDVWAASATDLFLVGTNIACYQGSAIYRSCAGGSCPSTPPPPTDGGTGPGLDAGPDAGPDAAPVAACGNTLCELGESCDGQSGTVSCPADCPGLTTGPPPKQYCCVNGACVGQGCPVAGCP
jgi:hypothetical protein